MELGHLDGVLDVGLEQGGQRFHGLGLAVDEEAVLDVAPGLLVPPGQVVAVAVAGEAVEDVDGGIQVVPLVEDLDPLDPLGDLPCPASPRPGS